MKFTFKLNGLEVVRNANNAETTKLKLDEIGLTYECNTQELVETLNAVKELLPKLPEIVKQLEEATTKVVVSE